MLGLYQRFKSGLNVTFDRLIDFCDAILMDSFSLPNIVRSPSVRAARALGDVILLLRQLPRLPATEFCANGWRIIYIGEPGSEPELCRVLFSVPPEIIDRGRIKLWDIQRQCDAWLAEGVDLVICELSRASPWKPRAPIMFSVPTWVKMSLRLPEKLDDLLVGNRRKRVRQRVNKGKDAGFSYRFSQDKADFDLFHHRMYRPYISLRHGRAASISNYEDQWQRSFKRGGLVMITQNEQPVAAALCYIARGVCYSVEGGVLDADEALLRQEINGMIDWYTMHWAHSQGARELSMGGTRPRAADGIYLYKRQWGARVMRRHKIYPLWYFLMSAAPRPELLAHLNDQGFIGEVGDKFYGLQVYAESLPIPAERIQRYRQDWTDEGVNGVVVFVPCKRPVMFPVLID